MDNKNNKKSDIYVSMFSCYEQISIPENETMILDCNDSSTIVHLFSNCCKFDSDLTFNDEFEYNN